MTVGNKPDLKPLQFSAHLPADLGPTLGLCALLFNKATMLGFLASVSRARPSLALRTAATAAMELTAAHRESSGTLAQGPATGLGFAPNSLPVWAVEPWFGVGFHCAQLSSVYGVL